MKNDGEKIRGKWLKLSQIARTLSEKFENKIFFLGGGEFLRAQTREQGPPLACASIQYHSLSDYSNLPTLCSRSLCRIEG